MTKSEFLQSNTIVSVDGEMKVGDITLTPELITGLLHRQLIATATANKSHRLAGKKLKPTELIKKAVALGIIERVGAGDILLFGTAEELDAIAEKVQAMQPEQDKDLTDEDFEYARLMVYSGKGQGSNSIK